MYPDDLFPGASSRSFIEPEADRRWYCVHTRPRQEKALARDLRGSRIPFYLPLAVHEGRTPAGRKTSSLIPLFSGYLFLLVDEGERIQALKGDRISNVIHVSDQPTLFSELRQIHQMLTSGLPISPEAVAEVGARVRILSGPLAGLVGTVIRRDRRERFVALVKILGAGASVILEDWQVEVDDSTLSSNSTC